MAPIPRWIEGRRPAFPAASLQMVLALTCWASGCAMHHWEKLSPASIDSGLQEQADKLKIKTHDGRSFKAGTASITFPTITFSEIRRSDEDADDDTIVLDLQNIRSIRGRFGLEDIDALQADVLLIGAGLGVGTGLHGFSGRLSLSADFWPTAQLALGASFMKGVDLFPSDDEERSLTRIASSTWWAAPGHWKPALHASMGVDFVELQNSDPAEEFGVVRYAVPSFSVGAGLLSPWPSTSVVLVAEAAADGLITGSLRISRGVSLLLATSDSRRQRVHNRAPFSSMLPDRD